MVGEAHHNTHGVDEQGECRRDHDLAGDGIGPWNEPQQVREQDEDKQARNEGEKRHPRFAHRIKDHALEKFDQHLRDTLQAGWD